MKLRADRIGPLDMFKIGVGPSSSHTVGPMVAALRFRALLIEKILPSIPVPVDGLHIEVELYGSLSATGEGHNTDGAVCAGLQGLHPRFSETDDIWAVMPALRQNATLEFSNCAISFDPGCHLKWLHWTMDEKPLPHPNTIRFRLYRDRELLAEQVILSVGGGFIEELSTADANNGNGANGIPDVRLPFPFNTAEEFLAICNSSRKPPWQVIVENQEALGLSEVELRKQLDAILDTMENCIEKGIITEGILPGGLNVRRRASELFKRLPADVTARGNDLRPSVYAMAVNEENAAGGRVVTAPTNGSSGLIPAVWRTLREQHELSRETLQNGLIVASVIGALVKTHASISGAEVGCQGEVGTSCAMAAAGAVSMLGGDINQIEQAAEIGIEHHLGMTCDPIKGLVQIPCIERNAMGAVKALNAAALSLASDGTHLISLDRVLQVMKETGLDMNQKYKETATGGLALG